MGTLSVKFSLGFGSLEAIFSMVRMAPLLNISLFEERTSKLEISAFLESLKRTKMGKRKKPKYVSYEANECNDQWHIDWSFDPHSKLNLLAIIDYTSY